MSSEDTIVEIVRAAKAEALREAAAHFIDLMHQGNPGNYGAILWLGARAAEIETEGLGA